MALLEEFNFKREVLESPEPVLVDFWAPWCGPCRMLTPVIDALSRDFKVCKVNTDKNPKLSARYNISSIPALLVFKGGEVAARYTGVQPEATLRAAMERLSRGR